MKLNIDKIQPGSCIRCWKGEQVLFLHRILRVEPKIGIFQIKVIIAGGRQLDERLRSHDSELWVDITNYEWQDVTFIDTQEMIRHEIIGEDDALVTILQFNP